MFRNNLKDSTKKNLHCRSPYVLLVLAELWGTQKIYDAKYNEEV